MTRVLFLNPGHLARGGVENGLVTLCRSLPSAWEVVIGITKGANFHDPQVFRTEYPDMEAVEVESKTGTREGRICAIQKVVTRIRPEIVIAPRVADAFPAVAMLKQRGMPVRLGANIRGCNAGQIADLVLFQGFIDLAVGASRLLQQSIRDLTTIPDERVFAISSGVPLPGRPIDRTRSNAVLDIGYIGRLDQHDKRVLDLAELTEQLAQRNVPVTLHIVGEGSDHYSSEASLRERLSSAPPQIKTVWHGWVSKAELQSELLPALDCCLLFSPSEGAPTSIREAMAYGVVPVISEFLGCHSEGLYKHRHNCMLFPVGDMATAADHIERLCRDREFLRQLAFEASRTINDDESIEGSTRKWRQAIEFALQHPCRCEGNIPNAALRSPGRLNWIPIRLAEAARGLISTRVADNPGDEWPSTLAISDGELVNTISRHFRKLEAQDSTVAPLSSL